MSSPTTGNRLDEGPWYRRWFGERYLELYPHRDEDEAREGVRLLVEHCSLAPGDAVLDLACGAGRHLGSLRVRGLRPVGLDLSRPLLLRARAAHTGEHLVQADMRVLPFGAQAFRAVTSFFTSFGYFRTDAEDRRVLVEIRRVLEEGGYLLLDFLNAKQVKENLSPRDEGEVNGRRVVQERTLVDEGRAVVKTIRIRGASGEDNEVFTERVRLYTPGELAELLIQSRLTPEKWFGDYDGAVLTDSGPRVIVLARAS